MEQLLTVKEAAELLRVHPETVRRMIRRGELAAVRVGSIWRIAPSDLKSERIVRQPRPPRHDPSPLAIFVTREWREGRVSDAPDRRRGRD